MESTTQVLSLLSTSIPLGYRYIALTAEQALPFKAAIRKKKIVTMEVTSEEVS
ncbi:MAG: hypothetical protein WCC17_25060 [Candidatus Nitrosopolaris sp.]